MVPIETKKKEALDTPVTAETTGGGFTAQPLRQSHRLNPKQEAININSATNVRVEYTDSIEITTQMEKSNGTNRIQQEVIL